MLAAHGFGLRINLTKEVVLSISGGERSLYASGKPRFLQIRLKGGASKALVSLGIVRISERFQMVERPRFFYGWVIVGTSIVSMTLIYGIRHSFSVFFPLFSMSLAGLAEAPPSCSP